MMSVVCTGCDYRLGWLPRGTIWMPKPDVFKSVVEHRWCYECNDIREIFCGFADEYLLDELESLRPPGVHHSVLDIMRSTEDKLDELRDQLQEMNGMSGLRRLFRFRGVRMSEVNLEIQRLEKVKSDIGEPAIVSLNERANKHFEEAGIAARCLDCGSTGVAEGRWDLFPHTCGGVLSGVDAGVRVSFRLGFDYVEYDERGNTDKKPIRGRGLFKRPRQ